jgi:hypothetical protein
MQLPFRIFGFPTSINATPLHELLQEERGENGRYLVAKKVISRGSYGIDKKIRITMSATEVSQVSNEYDKFVLVFLSEMSSEMSSNPIEIKFSHSEHLPYSRAALFVGKCLDNDWLNNSIIKELMKNSMEENYLIESMARFMLHDMFFFEYWRCMYKEKYDATEIWKLMTFILSHGLLDLNTLTIGEYMSKANCPQKKWNIYLELQLGAESVELSQDFGNFVDILVDRVSDTAEESFVIFTKDIKQGEPVELDYGDRYLLPHASQMRNYRDTTLHLMLIYIVTGLDTRILAALEKHMA